MDFKEKRSKSVFFSLFSSTKRCPLANHAARSTTDYRRFIVLS
ncbi:hypothetical protein [Ectobacillus panaciterrae]